MNGACWVDDRQNTFQLTQNGLNQKRKLIISVHRCVCNVAGWREEPLIPLIEMHIGLDILILFL